MENSGFVKFIFIVIAIFFLIPFVVLFSSFGIKINFVAVLLFILGVLIVWAIFTYNSFVSLNQKVKQASGTIDVYLKKRFDLIPNLVETVKGYKDYEKGLIEEITKLRSDYEKREDGDIKGGQDLNNRFTRIIALVENYPELKASEQFLMLQKNLSKVESELQAARRIYNAEVTEFNTKRYKFPSNIVASLFHFKEKDLFEIEENEKDNVKIEL